MKKAAGILSVALLSGFTGVVAVSVLTNPREQALADHRGDFDMESGPVPIRKAPAEEMPLRDALAAPGVSGAAVPPPQSTVSGPADRPSPPVSPLLSETLRRGAAPDPSAWVRGHSLFQGLMGGPARFLVNNTHLGSTAKLGKFLSDPARVGRYLNHRLIQSALESPILVKSLASPAMTKAFVESPAMRDPATVRALLNSGLVDRIARSRGVKEALGDSAFTGRVMLQPEVMTWMTRNPDAAKVLMRLGLSAGGLGQFAPR